MKWQMAAAATLATLFLAGPACADAVVVLGDGPERMCYLSAKTGIDPQEGLDHCNVALNNPLIMHDRAATFVNRGVIEDKMGRIDAAVEDFETCLRLIPDQPDAFVNRGVARISQGRFTEALEDLQKGISLGPAEPALAYYDRGIAYEKLGRIADAYYDYQRALKAAPGFTAASNALARFRIVSRPKPS
jgi:tetratricopeptide (TPR) repeat protein